MRTRLPLFVLFLCFAVTVPVVRAADAPAAKVEFDTHVKPILQRSCARCHAGSQKKGKFSINTRESIMTGGSTGAGLVPGKSAESLLIELVMDDDPKTRMPAEGDALTKGQINTLRAWIDQGAQWPEGFDFGTSRKAPLEPRRPLLPDAPAGSGLTNPIDRLLAPYLTKQKAALGATVSDRVFARRVSLDLVGLLPSADRLDAFEKDTRPNKRELYIDELLGDRRAYADHWLTFWNDALHNAYRGTGFIDGGRKQITGWLYQSLYDNKPYDQFVYDLISSAPGAEGFTYGIKWRGVVNDSQRREMQAAQAISQVFLGTNLKCASCHDSFVNDWKLTDSYGLASVFADGVLEIHRCDKPTGKMAEVHFLYPELGAIDGAAPRDARVKQLATILTSEKNGRLARTIVNRLWAWCMGRGIIEPIDDLDQPPFDADLLDWLASDLQDHGYDLKHTLRLICTSRAYQAISVGAASPDVKQFVFRGPLIKRMTAEQFVDALGAVTGQWQRVSGEMEKPDGRAQGGQLAAVRATLARALEPAPAPGLEPNVAPVLGKWIWSHKEAARSDAGGRIFLRKIVKLDKRPTRATAVATCDNEFTLYVNGQKVASSDNWSSPEKVDITTHLREGVNVFAVEAINWPDAETGKGVQIKGSNPGGFVFGAIGFDGDEPAWSVISDETWVWRKGLVKSWNETNFDAQGWSHAAVIGGGNTGPWNLASALTLTSGDTQANSGASIDPVRAALVDRDPLMQALGRSNREQVVTRRESIATTLQALELTNGGTLDTILKAGASDWINRGASDADTLIRRIYASALGRSPTKQELDVARSLIGDKPTADGVQDLLWVLVMLPEFQLVL